MMMYTAYMALVVSFVLVIVLNAWFVRRLSNLRDRAHGAKLNYDNLHAEMVELTETVGELSRGKDSNGLSIQTLEREIEETQEKIRAFLEEHGELRQEYGSAVERLDADAGEGDSANGETEEDAEVEEERLSSETV